MKLNLQEVPSEVLTLAISEVSAHLNKLEAEAARRKKEAAKYLKDSKLRGQLFLTEEASNHSGQSEPRRKRRKMSAAGRANIRKAVRARWAKKKAEKKAAAK